MSELSKTGKELELLFNETLEWMMHKQDKNGTHLVKVFPEDVFKMMPVVQKVRSEDRTSKLIDAIDRLECAIRMNA